MNNKEAIEVLLLRGQLRRASDPYLRVTLQQKLDAAISILAQKRELALRATEVAQVPPVASGSHPLYRGNGSPGR